MAEKQIGGYCKTCCENRNIYRGSPNHLLHLILTILTFGFWSVIWIGQSIQFGGWRCKTCGSKNVISGTRTSSINDKRDCPFCAEPILKKAIFCKHCRNSITPQFPVGPERSWETQSSQSSQSSQERISAFSSIVMNNKLISGIIFTGFLVIYVLGISSTSINNPVNEVQKVQKVQKKKSTKIRLSYLKPGEKCNQSFECEVLDGCGGAFCNHQSKCELLDCSIPAYEIIKDSKSKKIKRSVVVKLEGKLSGNDLKLIAKRIKSMDLTPYDRTFIGYYLPDMKEGAGFWATTHYDPQLKVKILGFGKDEKVSENVSASKNRKHIGSWSDENIGQRLVFFSKNKKTFVESKFKDGSGRRSELISTKVSDGLRFKNIEGNSYGEYYLLKPNGTLEAHDNEGFIKQYKRED